MNHLCSIEMLESALAGQLSSSAESALHQHLEECESCGAAMERLAGGSDWCQEAAALLGSDELDASASARDDWSVVDFTVEHLEPADEPHLLGRLGGYDILEIIGRGGMGVVLKGFDRELKRCVAIKVLAPHLAHSPLARKRFAREAQAAAAVVHPHVLAIHQVQPGGRLPFLVMPLVAGESLAQRLAARGSLELREILRIGMQAAAGLSAAHEQGLVHRDVKPANILLETGVERAVLTDFGLARAADDVAMTRWGIIAGTPQYMSPEQAQGQSLDGRSDLFSLGCVLYEMATGCSPFRADSTIATLRRLVDEDPASIATLNSELPQWFVNIVDRLLEKSPALRFRTAAEVSDLLERCLAHVQQPTIVSVPAEICFSPKKNSAVSKSQVGSNSKTAKNRFQNLGRTVFAVLLFLCCAWWVPAIMPVIMGDAEKAARAISETNLHRLTGALLAYAEEHGHYPPSVIYGKDGKGGPPHSWRVEILPYLGHRALYEEYHFDELWDSQHNSTLLAKIPAVFRSPADGPQSINAAYFGVISGDPKAVAPAPHLGEPVLPAPPGVSAGPGPGAIGGPAAPSALGDRLSSPVVPDAIPALNGGGVPQVPGVLGAPADRPAVSPNPDGNLKLERDRAEILARRLAVGQLELLYQADKTEWLRRTKLDLTGTMPSEMELTVFLADIAPHAKERVVERLLAESKQLTVGQVMDGVFVPNGSTIFMRPRGAKFTEITDGSSNTIALVEAKRNIPWTKPEDLTYDSTQSASPFGGWYKEGWYAGFGDGSVKYLANQNSPATLLALLTINGGEVVTPILVSQVDGHSEPVSPADAALSRNSISIRGRITEIDERHEKVTIDVGQRHGVKNQDFFLVLREVTSLEPVRSNLLSENNRFTTTTPMVAVQRTQIVGRLRVVQVGAEQSIAQVEYTADKAGLQRNDKVQLAQLSIAVGPGEAEVQNVDGSRVIEGSGFHFSPKPDSPQAGSTGAQAAPIGSEGHGARALLSLPLGMAMPNSVNAIQWRGRLGEQFDVPVIGRDSGVIWGSEIYTDDSDIATAAVHAGLVKVGEPAIVTLTIVKPRQAFVKSTRCGVSSLDWATPWESGYMLQLKQGPAAHATAGDLSALRLNIDSFSTTPLTALSWRDRLGEQFDVALVGCSQNGSAIGSLWGTDVYTCDSNLGLAAVHAGLLKVGEQGTVTVIIVKSPDAHVGSTRNGITSAGWGTYASSFVLQKKSAVAVSETKSPELPPHVNLWGSLNRERPRFVNWLSRHQGLSTDILLSGRTWSWKDNPDNSKTAEEYKQHIGAQFELEITGHVEGKVYGTDVYRYDSVIASAAVHAGLVRAGESATVVVTMVSPRKFPLLMRFPGSIRNGVESASADDEAAGYALRRKYSNAASFIGQFGTQVDVEVVGSSVGPVWGTGVYTADSDFATAAVHAGLVKLGEKGRVTVTIVRPPVKFEGSTHHGVTTLDYGIYPSAYLLTRLSDASSPTPSAPTPSAEGLQSGSSN